MARLAYLGPPGTFTHQAAIELSAGADELRAVATAEDVIDAVERSECEGGVVAFENSARGEVATNLDHLLLHASGAVIAGECLVPVTFDLLRLPGDDSELVGCVSHPMALAQCSDFIERRGLMTKESTSTASACEGLSEFPGWGWGALAPPLSGDTFDLVVAEREVEDSLGAVTRFVMLRRLCPARSGIDRTALSIHPRRDEPGSLVRMLQEFALRNINLTAIKSRPTGGVLGDYVFYVECEGHLQDPEVAAAIRGVIKLHRDTRFLGSFPEDARRGRAHGSRTAAAVVSLFETMEQMIEGE